MRYEPFEPYDDSGSSRAMWAKLMRVLCAGYTLLMTGGAANDMLQHTLDLLTHEMGAAYGLLARFSREENSMNADVTSITSLPILRILSISHPLSDCDSMKELKPESVHKREKRKEKREGGPGQD